MATDISEGGGAPQIAFVFNNVAGAEELLGAFGVDVEVHVLDASHEGLAQIAAILKGRSNVEALHIMGHGSAGSLNLGSLTLDAGNIGAFGDVLNQIGAALTEDGDILLYGCEVAGGALGAQFVGQIARATGADIAASTDPTGGDGRGGNWTLEYRQGEVMRDGALDAEMVRSLDTLLALPNGVQDVTPQMNVGSFIPGFTLSSTVPLIGNGDPDGIYFDTAPQDATLTVAADSVTLRSFDLTGLGFLEFIDGNPDQDGSFLFTVTGYKLDGVTTVVTTFHNQKDSLSYDILPDFSQFTGITKFDVRIQAEPYQGVWVYTAADQTFDSFTIANAVAPSPAAPSVPDLASASDTGISSTDNITNASTLSFSGFGTAGDIGSTVRVFVDKNGNGIYDAGIDASGTATVNNGAWSVDNISVVNFADGTYNVYSQVTSSEGNLISPPSNALQVTLDRTSPTLAITSNRSTLKAGESATITFTFSEDPGTTFTWNGSVGDVVVSGGTLSAIAGSGLTRTATFTPTPGTNGGTASISVAAGSYTDAAGNPGGGGWTPSLSFDTLAPQVSSITRVSSETSNAGSVAYTVVFDSSVTGVDASDFELNGTGNATGTVAGVTGSGTTYTVTVNNISGDGTLRLHLKSTGTGIIDAAGNAAPGFTGGQTYIFDNTAPAVTSVAVPAAATYRAGDPLELTVNFSEAVTVDTTGGTPSIDITLETGGVVHATYVSGSGSSALTFQYTVVAGNADADGIQVAGEFSPNGGTIRDAVGNNADVRLNSVALTSGVLVNALGPTVTSIVREGAALTSATSVNFIVTFSESVQGVDASDFTLFGSGAIGSIASVVGSGDTWTVVVDNISGDGTLRLDLNASGTGIGGTGGGALAGGFTGGEAYTLDFTPPVLDGAITISDNALKIGDSATVTFRFTEAVRDFTAADVTVPNGALSNLASSDGGRTWTATLTPNDGVSAAGNVLTLNYAGITDLAGNAGTGSASSNTYAVDTVRPHLASAIAISEDTLAIDGSATVTFVFNEAVTGFTIGDVTVPNGTLQDLRTNDNITYIATLTPNAGVSAASNVLTLNYAGIADQAGNAGTGTSSSGNYAVDTVRPTLAESISISNATLGAGQSATVTFTFTEPVTNFGPLDVTAPNATLRDFTSSNGGTSWTATLVPDDDTADFTNVLTLNYAGIADLAGNAGSGSVSSANYAVNTKAPGLALPIDISTTTLGIGSSATVTFTFTEPVLGFDSGDVTVPNGVLTDPVSSDGGVTWTATLTPNAGATAASNVLTLDYTGITNMAGNAGIGSASSGNYAVDTRAPTATVTMNDLDLRDGETATVTVTFSEIVSEFDKSAVTAPNGTLGDFATTDGGITWSATFTPSANTSAATNVISVNLTGVSDVIGNAGAGSATSPSYAVQTNPPVVPPTNPPTTTTIDGVTVERETLPVDPITGLASSVLTVPLITSNRPDDPSTPNSGLADIPLGLGSGSGPRTELLVSLPVGTGLRAEGPSALLSNQQALLDLVRRIEDQTPTGSSARLGMTGGSSSFLGSLAPDTLLQSHSLVLSAAPDLSSPPTIFVSGSSTTPLGGGHNATAIGLVIDTTGLPAGSTLQLNNVDFAAIIGAVTVRGGDGRNFVMGDSASQNIFLGADDDTLHGGGGDDWVGSLGGNDWLYGDDGNDTVSGGEGDDWLFGGAGHDWLYGGTGRDRLDGGSGNDRLYGGTGHDTMQGGAGNDSLWGGSGSDRLDGGAGNDTLKGEAGNDRIIGGLGRDKMWGGSGRDVFDFNSVKESKVGSQRDIIYDFKSGQDRIDLRDIDANTRLKGNQKFFWAGSEAPFLSPKDGSAFLKAGFTGKAGELRYENGRLMGDVNGDGRADFQIKIVGKFAYSDVIL